MRNVRAEPQSDAALDALVNPRAVGRFGTSFTIINLESTQPARLDAFEQAVRDQPEILDCFLRGRQQRLPRALRLPRRRRPGALPTALTL